MTDITITDLDATVSIDKEALGEVAGGFFPFFPPVFPTFAPFMPISFGPIGPVGGHWLYNNAPTFNPHNPIASSINAATMIQGQIGDAMHAAGLARLRAG